MDIKLNYIEKGAGFPLVLLHGNGEDNSYFRHQIDFFAHYYRVIAIDTRGHGKSPRGSEPFTIARFSEDLYEFICSLNIDKAHILGFSDGGNIALRFVLKYPGFVDKLILNGANLEPGGVKRRFQLPIELGYRITARFADKSDKAKHNYEMLGLMVNDPYISADELSAIDSETLVIAGTRDMIKAEHSCLIADSIPNSELCFIKGDHFIAAKKPELFNQKVKEFLDK